MTEYGNRWGPEGPPNEAYSRVSDPERFQSLHDLADEVISQLVQISEGVVWLQHEFSSPGLPRESSGSMRIRPINFHSLIGKVEPQEIEWQPWIRR